MFMTQPKPNRLANENSPYLLQHAFNPVDWYPWGDEALQRARSENSLLIVSIGYASCHWCHVMEKESFEDLEVAGRMNEGFVCIKVDRQERPDVDQLYMSAAWATTGRGGWPLNVITLPDGRPVFAGTYYPKADWLYILGYYSNLWQRDPEELRHQATEITLRMRKMNHLPAPVQSPASLPGAGFLHALLDTWKPDLDPVNGGIEGAPKFPMPENLSFLLRYGTRYKQQDARDHVLLTLRKMALGGIYDQAGGGFCRYSTDAEWRVPHFEKMLYDNAQLISLYSDAFSASGEAGFGRVVRETVSFTIRELGAPNGLFRAALDADSEGEEGAFYTWTAEQAREAAGEDAELMLRYFGGSLSGNWEKGRNVFQRIDDEQAFAASAGISLEQLLAKVTAWKQTLFALRAKRPRPSLDDNLLTCWNGLMISALVNAYRAFGEPAWLEGAENAATFYLDRLQDRNGILWRNAKADQLDNPAFLDDYAFLAAALLDLYRATFGKRWLEGASTLIRDAVARYTASDGIFFTLSPAAEPGLLPDLAELSDNVIPSSNSQMARNLLVLGTILNDEPMIRRAEALEARMREWLARNPAFHAGWAALAEDLISGPVTVKIGGTDPKELLRGFAGHYLPGVIFLEGDPGEVGIFVCAGKSCFPPVATAKEALRLIS